MTTSVLLTRCMNTTSRYVAVHPHRAFSFRDCRFRSTSTNGQETGTSYWTVPALQEENPSPQLDNFKPKSVNYHMSRLCNFHCKYCFHTAKTNEILPMAEAHRGLSLLRDAGTEKINFAGGEPFLHQHVLGELVWYCKEVLGIAVSIISNGSLIKDEWMYSYGQYVDILGISIDSFVENTNVQIGRTAKTRGTSLEKAVHLKKLCDELGIKFKINTVVNSLNWEEDMNRHLESLDPYRWKVFQVLLLSGENGGENDLRQASPLAVSIEQFDAFVLRHASQKCLVPESAKTMQNSYLVLDEKLRFLNCESGEKLPSESILDVGVQKALEYSGFDARMFLERGGVYDWNRTPER
mmetsp:Transcript_32596/g.77322  ORF Transcript_32596/g.77322 Transcript_32596/m.77322 type:complete len:352 (-) Transcript_32596:214-1269(-)